MKIPSCTLLTCSENKKNPPGRCAGRSTDGLVTSSAKKLTDQPDQDNNESHHQQYSPPHTGLEYALNESASLKQTASR